ncbi:hypothetical protein SAMN04488515_2401 [Cognatiyoonia koreensis]|uniref:Uncharacterized protein n=1 Tax=Cognatiyoonia koreensis TaxID=364200 RepID=A0A1I0RB45_9RHOB|nr:hypothetical protein [Cognatiyoonia koreensis]SEW37850.1 hypothetical protein SAMN04488515_2401 [Cognatiyoonia koreensis]
MVYTSLQQFLGTGKSVVANGPIGLILLEDAVEADSTVRHHLDSGFETVIVFGSAEIALAEDVASRVHRVHHDMLSDDALTDIVNGVIRLAPGQWIYYCYNTEYLFFPFCEHRTVGEMATFSLEERRSSILTYVIDLYAGDLEAHPNAVALEDAYLDKSGYYALARKNSDNEFADRQLDFFGGLRWRFEEHIPMPRRRIDRVSIFRATTGLEMRADHTFNDPEYNTYACPWHHSLTAALCSFRTAKALKRNPGSGYQISSFKWHNSAPFEWRSQQLLDLGLMEPGQWF